MTVLSWTHTAGERANRARARGRAVTISPTATSMSRRSDRAKAGV
jgi:hypothetical protein